MIITPEVIVSPDAPTIKFRTPRDQVDLYLELPKILKNQGWALGTYFHVQFVSHDRTRLLSSADFVVSGESESLQTNEENPYQPVTKTVFNHKVDRISGWWEAPDSEVVWHPGLKLHQVLRGDEVVYESKDKDLAIKVAEGERLSA